jgi:hypothetical protein
MKPPSRRRARLAIASSLVELEAVVGLVTTF